MALTTCSTAGHDRSPPPGRMWGIGWLGLLLLAPLFVSRSREQPLCLGLPGIQFGDEPHYLVLINSLIRDGDFDLANNYQDAHQGGLQAGRRFAGQPLDHHVNWYRGGQLVRWSQAYEADASRWRRDDHGHPVPTLRSSGEFRPLTAEERSQHPVGLAVVLAPWVFPLRGTSLVEPMALLCSGLATVAGCCAWCSLVQPYTTNRAHLIMAAQVAYLGSPLWHYGQVLFAESCVGFFIVAAFAVALRGDRYGLAGVLLGAGILIKAPLGLIALPLIGDALLRCEWKRAVQCTGPVAAAVMLVLYANLEINGGWLRGPQAWESGSMASGLAGLTFSIGHGLLPAAPALCLSGLVLREWFANHRRDATLMTMATLLYAGLIACWAEWWGGSCYSARLILPVVPFLFAPLPLLFEAPIWRTRRALRVIGNALMILSIVWGAIAAFECNYVWGKHPLQLLMARKRWGSSIVQSQDFATKPGRW
jgi:hypothetical protein